MTKKEAASDFFAIYGTDVPTELVMGWIDELEGQMLAEIAATHCDAPADACPDSADGMAEDARLFAAFPYDGVYTAYLHMKADLYFGDTEKYENSAMQFASAYSAFADYYNRTHLPLTGAKIRL